MKIRAAIGLGAKLGAKTATILAARQAIAALPNVVEMAFSSCYQSAAIPAGGPDFINAVQLIETQHDAAQLLACLQGIEQQAGRQRSYPNAPRSLDLDLLLYGDMCIQTPHLILPHPRLQLRAFVLLPLLEVWPAAWIPGLGAAADFLPAVQTQTIHKQ